VVPRVIFGGAVRDSGRLLIAQHFKCWGNDAKERAQSVSGRPNERS